MAEKSQEEKADNMDLSRSTITENVGKFISELETEKRYYVPESIQTKFALKLFQN